MTCTKDRKIFDQGNYYSIPYTNRLKAKALKPDKPGFEPSMCHRLDMTLGNT